MGEVEEVYENGNPEYTKQSIDSVVSKKIEDVPVEYEALLRRYEQSMR
jgi:hypothetical protein